MLARPFVAGQARSNAHIEALHLPELAYSEAFDLGKLLTVKAVPKLFVTKNECALERELKFTQDLLRTVVECEEGVTLSQQRVV